MVRQQRQGAALRLCVSPHYPPSQSWWGGGWLARDQHFSLQGPGDRAPSQALDCGCTNVSPGLEPWERVQVDRGRGFSKGGPAPSPQLTLLPSFSAPIPPPWIHPTCPTICWAGLYPAHAWQKAPLLGAQAWPASHQFPLGMSEGLPDLQLGEGPLGWVDGPSAKKGSCGHPNWLQDPNGWDSPPLR